MRLYEPLFSPARRVETRLYLAIRTSGNERLTKRVPYGNLQAGGMMRHLELSIEREIVRAIEGLDLTETRRCYREQNEFVVLDRFLTRPAVEEFLREVDLLTPGVSRDDVSGYKKEGSVNFSALQNQAPAILSLYRSPTLLTFLSRLVDAPLMLCPENDPHSCTLSYYKEPGDHIGFHYDTSYYKGKHYTVLVGLVERSEHCRLVARVRKRGKTEEIRETRIPMYPGTVVLFNGDKLWHAVTPVGKDEERITLMLKYVTSQKMGNEPHQSRPAIHHAAEPGSPGPHRQPDDRQ